MFFAFLEHAGEALPGLGRGVLPAEFFFAVAPPAAGNHRREARVGGPGIDGDSAAETRTDDPHAAGPDLPGLKQEVQRIFCALDLFQADEVPAGPFAVAAAGHVKAQGDIAQAVEFGAGLEDVLGRFVAAKPVQDDEGGALFARREACRP